MKQAYLIAAHEHPSQLVRLVNKLDSPNANFYIHIDNKVRDVFSEKDIPELNGRANIHIQQLINVYWGGYSQVEATLLLLREAIKDKANGYFHLLSGVDYPLKPTAYIENFFEHNDNDYVCYVPEENKCEYFINRYYFYDYPCMDKRTYKVSLLHSIQFQLLLLVQRLSWFAVQKLKLRIRKDTGMKYYHGSNWFSLSRNAVEYILKTLDANPWIEKRFHYTAVCDESFFTMFLMNNEERRKNVVNDDLRLHLPDGKLNRGGYVLTEQDFARIQQSPALFGRKVIPSKSDGLMERIDRPCRIKI